MSTTAIMFSRSQHPPIVLEDPISGFFEEIPEDIRPGNPQRQFWQDWYYDFSLYGFNCTSEEYQHKKCWGWTILRASYDDDEEFSKAIAAIRNLALVRLEDEYRDSSNDVNAVIGNIRQVPGRPSKYHELLQQHWSAMLGPAQDALPEGEPLTPDWVITHELVQRYHNVIVEGSETLEGADVSKAWGYVHALNHGRPEPSARGEFFIYLDKESIHRLARAPSKDELASMVPADRSQTAWEFWVKVVSTSCELTEDGKKTDQMLKDPVAKRRMRLYDFFEIFIGLCHGCFDEIGIEGWGHERIVEERGREWEFCKNDLGDQSRVWELYGEKVP